MVELTQAAVWHRQVAALAAAADRAGVGHEQLPAVRARLLAQQAWFAEAEQRAGVAIPHLVPTPTETAAAAPALGDLSGPSVAEALQTSASTLDAVDSVLAAHLPAASRAGSIPAAPAAAAPVPAGPSLPAPPPPPPSGPPLASPGPVSQAPISQVPTDRAPAGRTRTGIAGRPTAVRNGLVYGGYALVVLMIQVLLLAVADEVVTLPLLAPLCLFVLPAFAWAAGWFTVGAAFRPEPGEPPLKRTPRLGAVVCFLPNVVLCAGLGALFIANRFGG